MVYITLVLVIIHHPVVMLMCNTICCVMQAYHVELKNDMQKSQEAKSPEEELSGNYFKHAYNTLMTVIQYRMIMLLLLCR